MSVKLEAVRASRDSKLEAARLDRDNPRVSGADLARRCWTATARESLAREGVRARMSDHERESLAQELALRVLERSGPQPRKSECGVTLLRRIAANLVREDGTAGRSWRDTVEHYRTAAQRQRDTGPMVVSLDQERATTDPLAAAVLASLARDGSPAPVVALDARDFALDLARMVAQTLAMTLKDQRAVETAVLAAALRADGRAAAPLAAIAVARGCSLITCKRDSAAGAKVLASIGAGRLAALAGEAAERLGRSRAQDRPTLDPVTLAALRAVDATAARHKRRKVRASTSAPVTVGATGHGTGRWTRQETGAAATAKRVRQAEAKRDREAQRLAALSPADGRDYAAAVRAVNAAAVRVEWARVGLDY